MKLLKYYGLGLIIAGSMTLTGCSSDYLDTTSTQSVSESDISSTLQNIYAALNGIHRKMVSQDTGVQCLGGEPGIMMCRDAEADDMTWIKNTWMKAGYLGWTANMNDQSVYNYNIWQTYYGWILNANKILNSVEEVSDIEKASKLYNQVKGEALCIRAWAHFNLVQLYAKRYVAGTTNSQDGIPYRTAATSEPMARNTVEDVYKLILEDLTNACTLLDGLSVKSLTGGANVNHYSAMTAWGLKARVALAMQDYTNAATYAATSIKLAEAAGLSLMKGDELYNGFANITSTTNEAMYAATTLDDQTVYFYSFYAYMSWNFSSSAVRQGVKCINAETYNTMSKTDLRRAWWDPTGKMDVPSTSFARQKYQNRKFAARSTADNVGDVAFMRLAEMYLTEAEALARAGSADAQTVFTKFQLTRDPSYVSKGNTGDALITEIMNSRRVELWGEGFRFYDLKRLNLDLKRGSNFSVAFCSFLEKKAGEKGWVWEIPKSETDYNKLCTKNY
jgi:hypothetical protein